MSKLIRQIGQSSGGKRPGFEEAAGEHPAREVNRAHILSALDLGIPEAQIMAVLGVGRTAIWRTRSAYLEGGAEYQQMEQD